MREGRGSSERFIQASDTALVDLAKAVKAARLRMGLSQTELARAIGASQGNIARLESGSHAPSVRVLQNIAAATNSSLSIDFRPLPTKANTTMTDTFTRPGISTDRRRLLGGAMGMTGMLGFGPVRNISAQEATAAATAAADHVWSPPQYDPEPSLFTVLDRNDDTVTLETIDGEVEVPDNPERIISLAWEYIPLFELGISDPVTGIGYFDYYESPLWNSGDLTESMHASLADATLVPNPSELDIEQLAILNPDLILTTPQWHDETIDTLAQLAPTVRGNTHSPSVPRAGVRDFGELFGKSDEAKNAIEEHDAFIDRARLRVEPLVAGKKAVAIQPTADSFRAIPSYYTQNDGVFAHINGAYQLHRELGIAPSGMIEHLADDDRESFFLGMSMEQIGEIDADFIFVYDLNLGDYETFVSNSLVQLTDAAKKNQVHAFHGMTYGLGLAGVRAGVASIVESLTGEPFE